MGDDDKTRSGWRFDPFDQELIADYLKPRITKKQFSCNLVKNREVYGPCSNPWQVFDPKDECWLKSPRIKPSQKYMFVFTRLSKLSSSAASKNTSKKAGCGTWVGKTSRKKIRDDKGNLIGESRYLVFEINETHSTALGVGVDLDKLGSYTMHEYRLSGINEPLNSAEDTVVICKITHDSSKTPTIALKSGATMANCVSGSTSEARFKEDSDKNFGGTGSLTTENLTKVDGAVCNDLDGRNTLTLENLIAVDNIEESRMLTTQSLAVINSDVGKLYAPLDYNDLSVWDDLDFNDLSVWDDCGGGFGLDDLPSGDFCLDELGGYDTDWIMACLDSNHQEEPVENSKPGKRKFEDEENSCPNKKTCL